MAASRRILKDRRYPLLREFKGTTLEMDRFRSLGAHSIGIGRKMENGKPTNTLALRVYVDRKRPESALSAESLIPPRIRHHSRLGRQGDRHRHRRRIDRCHRDGHVRRRQHRDGDPGRSTR